MTNYSNLTNEQLYIQYQKAKFNFRNAIEGTQEEIEADRIFTELSKEIEQREDFDWLSYKLAETEQENNAQTNSEIIEDSTYILTDCNPETFNKIFIEKQDYNGIITLGYNYKYISNTDFQEIIDLMTNTNLNYCYSIEEDRFFEIDDLKEIIEN